MIRKCQAEWLGHVACIPPNWLPNIALLGYTPGKLHHGCHPKRWIEDILSQLNLSLEGALRAAQDRKHWKTKIRDRASFKDKVQVKLSNMGIKLHKKLNEMKEIK